MTRLTCSLTWLWFGMALTEPASAASSVDSNESDKEIAETLSVSSEPVATKGQQRVAADEDVHWQFGVALTAFSYQRASFNVEPLSSGQSLPGILERTNRGPSGGSVLFEPGYVIRNQLVLGILLDIGSGLNESEVEDLSFQISQSLASFAVGPRVAYYLAPASSLRPFATIAFGYTKTPSKQAGQGLRLTEYQGFAGLGLSYFPLPFFSFDTSFRAAYGIGSGYVDTGVMKNAALSGSVYTLMWTLGTSGWLR